MHRLGLAVVIGCTPYDPGGSIEPELAVAPALTDLGTLAVGDRATAELRIRELWGVEVKVKSVRVINTQGDSFSFVGETQFVVDGQDPATLIVVDYQPVAVGYHFATVEVTHNGLDSPAIVQVRGRGVLPDATVGPLGIDFGFVAVGDSKTEWVTVSNDSSLVLTIADANIVNPVFELGTLLPVTMQPETEVDLAVVFTPDDPEPAFGTLSLLSGSGGFPTITLRGNDCENGDPADYDRDADGQTSCAGDCNDDDPSVRHGANERPNGVDDNCNGTVDEGTGLSDDDGDGYCDDPAFCSDGSMPGDCSDSPDPGANTDQINPGETEVPNNGIDDDCDGAVDE